MPDTPELEQQLLDKIPTDGTGVGNTSLIRDLGWQEQDYWDVRNRLVDRGVLEVGRGRGGSVRRVITTVATVPPSVPPNATGSSPASEAPAAGRAWEGELYEPIAKVLDESWVRERRFESSIVQVTALQGRRLTGGKWSRPDIAIATLSTYPYVPGRHFDVVTFEVKPSDAIDVTAVYEALAHLRSATMAYVMIHVPEDQQAALQEGISEVAAVAKQHGVGLITFADAAKYETWEDLAEAERSKPDPRRLNDFLATQFTAEQHEKLIRWFR
jgi:hypothetical protein